VIDIRALEDLVDSKTVLVAVMAANNETGVLTDVRQVADIAHSRGALYLCDATQQVGKLPVDFDSAGVDFAALSAHKLYGPQGMGALVATAGARRALEPLLHGGGHQGGLRSGTLNLAGIVGFGEAAGLAKRAVEEGEAERLEALRASLEQRLVAALAAEVNGGEVPRLPNTTNARIPGVDADALIANCPDVAFSSGSACTSAVLAPSHVLVAMGRERVAADESVRLSLGRFTTASDVEVATARIIAAVERVRELTA
jgi:cysteine desulfurase